MNYRYKSCISRTSLLFFYFCPYSISSNARTRYRGVDYTAHGYKSEQRSASRRRRRCAGREREREREMREKRFIRRCIHIVYAGGPRRRRQNGSFARERGEWKIYKREREGPQNGQPRIDMRDFSQRERETHHPLPTYIFSLLQFEDKKEEEEEKKKMEKRRSS